MSLMSANHKEAPLSWPITGQTRRQCLEFALATNEVRGYGRHD
jgi:hypothetical protein